MTLAEIKLAAKLPPVQVWIDGQTVQAYVRPGKLCPYPVVVIHWRGDIECRRFTWEAIERAINRKEVLYA